MRTVAPAQRPWVLSRDDRRSGSARVVAELLALAATAAAARVRATADYDLTWFPVVGAAIITLASLVSSRARVIVGLAAAGGAAAFMAVYLSWFTALLFLVSAVIADAFIRPRPLNPLCGPNRLRSSLPVVVALFVAAWGTSPQSLAYAPISTAVASGMLVLTALWCVIATGRHRWTVLATAAVVVITAARSPVAPILIISMSRMTIAAVIGVLFVTPRTSDGTQPDERLPALVREPGGDRRLARTVLVVAAPGVLWWMSMLAFLSVGVLEHGSLGIDAWALASGSVPRTAYALLASSTIPIWTLTLMTAGAALTVFGRLALRPLVAAWVGFSLLSLLLTQAWWIGVHG